MQNDLHGVQMLPLQTTIYIANNFYRNKTLLDTTDWGPDLKKKLSACPFRLSPFWI